MTVHEVGDRARAAARQLARAASETRRNTLHQMAGCLTDSRADILDANGLDLTAAREAGKPMAFLDRLTLNAVRLDAIAEDLRQVADLPDPIGETFDKTTLPNGLRIHKQRVPLGVLAVIYESRPNVTVDVAGLAIKTGNAAILRGGSEAYRTNQALVQAVHAALASSGLPKDSVQVLEDPDRALLLELLREHETVDLVIPRGGNALHEFCRQNSTIPVITGGIGICHLFVDESADLPAALEVIRNAKVQRPTVCNALDTVLVHRGVAGKLLPDLVQRLAGEGVTFRAHPSALSILKTVEGSRPSWTDVVNPAGQEDFDTEWLSLVLGLKVVDSLEEALEHIDAHSTAHSDGILTRNETHARLFIDQVDSAAVYVNASTRFTDGSQLGLGAEVAVSTQRLHARGPMGPRELTTYKWVIVGDGHVRP